MFCTWPRPKDDPKMGGESETPITEDFSGNSRLSKVFIVKICLLYKYTMKLFSFTTIKLNYLVSLSNWFLFVPGNQIKV